MFILSLLHLVATKAELFVPEEISDSALRNEDGLAAKSSDSDESADPFGSSDTDPEGENRDSNETSSQLAGNPGLLGEAKKTLEETPLENSLLTKESNEKQETQSEQDSQLFSAKDAREEGEKGVFQTLKAGQVPKPGVPYWTEVYVDKKMKSVLVNVKTVTIIESINSAGKAKYPTTTASSRTVDPYIKIQMPSAPTISSTSKKPSQTKSGKSTSVTVKTKTIKPTTTKLASRHQTKPAVAPLTVKTLTKSTSSKKPQTVTVTAKSSSAKSSSKSVSTKTAKKVAKSSSASTGPKEKVSTSTKQGEAESGNSLGSIFNVLKDMPYGGKDSESLYIEGTFRFPKKKSLSNKSFKMNGYISAA